MYLSYLYAKNIKKKQCYPHYIVQASYYKIVNKLQVKRFLVYKAGIIELVLNYKWSGLSN